MADEIKIPWWKTVLSRVSTRWLEYLGVSALAFVLYVLFGIKIGVPDQPDVPIWQDKATGWIDSPDDVAAAMQTMRWPEFAATPAGRAVFGDEVNVALWKAIDKQYAKWLREHPDYAPHWGNDQNPVGMCVGTGTNHAAMITYAVECESNPNEEWRPLSAESIYAAMRVDIGKGQIRGDGGVGAWSAKAATDVGFAPAERIDQYDLRILNPLRAREWGRSGVPAPVKALQVKHRMGAASRVGSWDEAKKALRQGYGIIVCSNVGFESKKDADGFQKPSGTWNHCMALIGCQVGKREGGLILNSWPKTSYHKGPAGWGDPPPCSFWVDAAVVDRMLKQGDSFTLSNFDGFPAKRPANVDWIIRAPVRERLLADRFDGVFALAP